MNNKMTTHSQPSKTEPKEKTKLKMNEANKVNRNRITEMEITWRVIRGEGEGRMGKKVQGISSINGRYKIDKVRLRIV